MTVFDPEAMTAPLASRADAVRGPNGVEPPAVLVEVQRGGRVASVAHGVDDLGTGTPATTNQTFEVGSQTKMMTAVVILQLAEQGLINLDRPLSAYLPDGTTDGIANAGSATIRQVLAMRSGIPNYADGVDIAQWLDDHPGQAFGPQQALEVARGMDAPSTPGGDFVYGNTSYLLLGLLIEQVTGKAWQEAIKERVFDRAGMDHSTGYTYAGDPDRISSYRLKNGQLDNVTSDQWVARGESGVVSTTSDLIAFLRALMVDKTLISEASLAEMTSMRATGGGNFFGLGMFIQPISGSNVYGFAGGTLGTSSVTWFDPKSQIFVSLTSTVANTNSSGAAIQLDTLLRNLGDWALPDGGPVEVRSVSAAGLSVATTDDGLRIAAKGAALTLDLTLRTLAADTMRFEDGSVLIVGDGTADKSADDEGNFISVPGDYRGALNADNLLMGLGGDDIILGGRGNDRVYGDHGDDRINGNAGNDRIFGGPGHDVLRGGAGNDVIGGGSGKDTLIGGSGADELIGGAGADTFLFYRGDSAPSAPDHILDFDNARDRIDLRAIDAIEGDKGSAFTWIGAKDFTGKAGQLHVVDLGDDLRLEGDTNGDGRADLAIILDDLDGLSAHRILL